MMKPADAAQLVVDLDKAQRDTKQEFAYCSLFCFVHLDKEGRHVGCGLHLSSLIPSMWNLEFLSELLDQRIEPLAIIGNTEQGCFGSTRRNTGELSSCTLRKTGLELSSTFAKRSGEKKSC